MIKNKNKLKNIKIFTKEKTMKKETKLCIYYFLKKKIEF